MRFVFFSKKKTPAKRFEPGPPAQETPQNLPTFSHKFQSGHMGSRGNHPEFFVTTVLSYFSLPIANLKFITLKAP
jgi:hypothetical protein